MKFVYPTDDTELKYVVKYNGEFQKVTDRLLLNDDFFLFNIWKQKGSFFLRMLYKQNHLKRFAISSRLFNTCMPLHCFSSVYMRNV